MAVNSPSRGPFALGELGQTRRDDLVQTLVVIGGGGMDYPNLGLGLADDTNVGIRVAA